MLLQVFDENKKCIISHILLVYVCMSIMEQLLSSSLKRIRVAYNNSFRFLHRLARYVSAREHQVLNNIRT